MNNLTYDDLSNLVNESYKKNQSIRQTMLETDLPFDLVWDMSGYKDWMDFYEDDQP
jgi:hypothetical protein